MVVTHPEQVIGAKGYTTVPLHEIHGSSESHEIPLDQFGAMSRILQAGNYADGNYTFPVREFLLGELQAPLDVSSVSEHIAQTKRPYAFLDVASSMERQPKVPQTPEQFHDDLNQWKTKDLVAEIREIAADPNDAQHRVLEILLQDPGAEQFKLADLAPENTENDAKILQHIQRLDEICFDQQTHLPKSRDFVQLVLERYKNNLEDITRDINAIRNVAHVFGDQTADAVALAILAEAHNYNPNQQVTSETAKIFWDKANQQNHFSTLSPSMQNLLRFLAEYQHKTLDREPITKPMKEAVNPEDSDRKIVADWVRGKEWAQDQKEWAYLTDKEDVNSLTVQERNVIAEEFMIEKGRLLLHRPNEISPAQKEIETTGVLSPDEIQNRMASARGRDSLVLIAHNLAAKNHPQAQRTESGKVVGVNVPLDQRFIQDAGMFVITKLKDLGLSNDQVEAITDLAKQEITDKDNWKISVNALLQELDALKSKIDPNTLHKDVADIGKIDTNELVGRLLQLPPDERLALVYFLYQVDKLVTDETQVIGAAMQAANT